MAEGTSPDVPAGTPTVELVLADVDGTLVTQDKLLTPAAVEAVHELHRAGIGFAVTSGRPPRGMAMLVEPLQLSTPLAAFNGGLLVDPDMAVLEQHVLPTKVVRPALDLLGRHDLTAWLYRGARWYVRDAEGPHVARERWTVKFDPTVVDSYDDLADDVVKIVGVSDDADAMAAAVRATQEQFGDHVSAATSQPYYLDITHPSANKGEVVGTLSARLGVAPERIATIGDMPNDVLMFSRSGLSIAMGNADPGVQRAARRVTTTNEDEGFAAAMARYVLGTRISGVPDDPG